MKRNYVTPIANKVVFSYHEHVAAASYPLNTYADPWHADKCTWGDGTCSLVFNVSTTARGLNDCANQG